MGQLLALLQRLALRAPLCADIADRADEAEDAADLDRLRVDHRLMHLAGAIAYLQLEAADSAALRDPLEGGGVIGVVDVEVEVDRGAPPGLLQRVAEHSLSQIVRVDHRSGAKHDDQ